MRQVRWAAWVVGWGLASAGLGAFARQARAAEPGPGWEIHEWGLVDATLAGGPLRVIGGPRGAHVPGPGVGGGTTPGVTRPKPPMATRKPVLYVHLGSGVATQTFSAEIAIPGGTVVEHWPETGATAHGVVWKDVRASREGCAERRSLPLRDAPAGACTTGDGQCERDELPRYVTPDAACLALPSGAASLLFYRGAATSPRELPLALALDASGSLTVRAREDMSGAPGVLMRVARPCRGPQNAGAGMAVAIGALPGAGGSTTLPYPSAPGDLAALRQELERNLAALGMTRSEANVFLEAWLTAIFTTSVVDDALIYWMPPARIDAFATLTVTPAPTALRRAMLVRVDLGATCGATAGPR